ncbi:DUF2513 domain-containing protein [Aeoliella sp. ICT_H6.2]|uniref:DUF2513 domain-containing protein n=1 Tax=Aeoliella straminimaris TaxID=2954799 RepID=A0A9X2FIA6_9BACT|nr:DUF2513 domain-containing protein [Aeoliella straminimaris]MCO6046926.1 DUF2513 domain-containing protein [Aeoliella straminimaris]
MKRDIDLCRQLLFDLEAHGTECAINVLRSGLANEADDRLRYHLRLLVDAGLVKDIERATNGSTCVRLTNAGIELLELCRSDARWRDAKTVVLERTGGLSLTVIRTVLTKWAVESATLGYTRVPRRAYRPYYRRDEAMRRLNGNQYDRNIVEVEDDLRLVRTAPDYRERADWRERLYDTDYYYNGTETDAMEPNVGVQLPIYLV